MAQNRVWESCWQKLVLVWMAASGRRPPARPLARPIQLPGAIPTVAVKQICSYLTPLDNGEEGAPVNPVHFLTKPSQAQAFSVGGRFKTLGGQVIAPFAAWLSVGCHY